MVALNCWLKSTDASHTSSFAAGVGVALTLVSPLSAVTGTVKLVPESSEISTDIESVSESASETSKVISTNFVPARWAETTLATTGSAAWSGRAARRASAGPAKWRSFMTGWEDYSYIIVGWMQASDLRCWPDSPGQRVIISVT